MSSKRAANAAESAPLTDRTALVIGPDVILDVAFKRPGWDYAALLFDAIAADLEAGVTVRPAYVASSSIQTIYYSVFSSAAGVSPASSLIAGMMRLFQVAPMLNSDVSDALWWDDLEFEDALQLAACRRVLAKYYVTRNDFGVKRMRWVTRRTPEQILWLFKRPVPQAPPIPSEFWKRGF